MGERTDDVNESERPEELERDVEDIRGDIGSIVSELDRRRHDALDVRLQVRKHSKSLAVAAFGLVALLGGMTAFSIWRRRRRNRPFAKAQRFRQALSRMIEHPELVAQPRPNLANKALAAAVSSVAGHLAETVAERLTGAISH